MSKTLERILAIHSSPAICGLKASNLICIDYDDDIFEEIEGLNKKYKKLCFYILKKTKTKVLVLVYRRDVFERKLEEKENIEFLKQNGYDISSINSMLLCLKDRLLYNDFPHEIGVFLGYDICDIKSFIKKEKCQYVGYWQVYSNVDEKKIIFTRYNKCRECVIKLIDRGFPIENFMR